MKNTEQEGRYNNDRGPNGSGLGSGEPNDRWQDTGDRNGSGQDSFEQDDRLAEIRQRREERRRRETRNRRITIAVVIIAVLAAALCLYRFVLVDRYDLPFPSMSGNKTGTQQSAVSILDENGAPITSETSAPVSIDSAGNTGVSGTSTDIASVSNGADNADKSGDSTGNAGSPDDDGEIPSENSITTVYETEAGNSDAAQEPAPEEQDTVSQADALAAGYDYDGAIALLKALPDYDSNSALQSAVARYESDKAACVPVDVTQVSHIFYHSLINDPSRAFNVEVLGQSAVDGMNAWMTTVDEFDKLTQRLYDAGYVYVRLRDLVKQTTDADGTVHFTPNDQLMLPEGKKALVLSVDDLSYYHSYEKAGFPEKLVLDDNGDVKCLYTDSEGNTSVGDYDVVPRLNTFLKEHPDGAYHGARGLIAMTGYDGVFGYRTDIDYKVKLHLMDDQAKWLDAHPDFDYDAECAEAKKIADAIKASGWEFASHTWGHLSVTSKTADELKVDNEKWVNTVEPIVGKTDTIIFAFGNDIGSWEGYSLDNDKYAYYKSAGYNFFCNVDASQKAFVQITDSYVRQARINADGYRLYQCSIGEPNNLAALVDTDGIFDTRRPTPVVANGQG